MSHDSATTPTARRIPFRALLVSAVAALAALLSGGTPSYATTPTVAGLPAASGQMQMWSFWGGVGNGVVAGCYIISAQTGINPTEARCDRYYHATDGTFTQGATLMISKGRSWRDYKRGDATGGKYGRHLRAGDSIRELRFRCVDKSTAFVCRDLRTHHGFKILQHGYKLF